MATILLQNAQTAPDNASAARKAVQDTVDALKAEIALVETQMADLSAKKRPRKADREALATCKLVLDTHTQKLTRAEADLATAIANEQGKFAALVDAEAFENLNKGAAADQSDAPAPAAPKADEWVWKSGAEWMTHLVAKQYLPFPSLPTFFKACELGVVPNAKKNVRGELVQWVVATEPTKALTDADRAAIRAAFDAASARPTKTPKATAGAAQCAEAYRAAMRAAGLTAEQIGAVERAVELPALRDAIVALDAAGQF